MLSPEKTIENMEMVPLYWLLSGVRARRDNTNGLPLDVRHLLPTIFPKQIACLLLTQLLTIKIIEQLALA